MGRVWSGLATSQLFYVCSNKKNISLSRMASMFILIFSMLLPKVVSAACGGTVRTWDAGAGNTNWSSANNWSANNIPDSTAEDVVIVSGAQIPNFDTSYSVGCVEIQSGTLTANTNNRTLTVTGDYFRNLTINSFTVGSGSFTLTMSGSAAQTLENYDDLRILTIGSAASDQNVTITKPFTLQSQLNFTAGWTGTLYINADVVYNGGAVTVPAGATVVIGDGAKLTTNGNWTISGTLKLMPGASMNLGNNEVLTINNGGSLIVAGASGNSGKILSQDFNDIFTFTMNGILNADYFLFGRMSTAGLNIGATGVVQKLDNGEFHYPQTNGDAVRVAAGAVLPATMNNIGFTNDFNTTGVRNFNSAYTGTNVTINNWTGTNGGNANERADAGNRIGWGTQGATKLTVTDASNPPTTINQNTTGTLATFSFALNQAATATDITSVKISMIGTASTSDINYIEVFRDVAGSMNCAYNAGTDASITGQVSLSGNPLSYTATIPAGNVSTSSDTARHCIHVLVNTTATAQDAKTIQFSIQGTGDVVNSQSYVFSDSASPPLSVSPATYINGDAIRKWQGDISTAWNTAGNWIGNAVPTTTRDCEVGAGTNVTVLNANGNCQVATFKTGGTFDFNAVGRILNITGGIEIQSGFTFQNPTNVGVLNFNGTVAAGVKIATPIPANVTINNTGAAGNDYIEINGDTQIGDNSGNGGDVTINNGTLRVNAPYTLTIKGNLTCAALAGNGIEIAPGATLKMGNNKTITLNNGCNFKVIGNSSNNSIITADNSANSYNVVVNAGATIQAQYYTFENLGTLGLRIAGTIDNTYHLQNGTFRYPVGNNGKMLDLDVAVPTNSMDNMTFSLAGSVATGTTNIDTATYGTPGTVTLNNYTGDLAGPSFDNDPTYLLSWLGATNTLEITQEATAPATLSAGSTYNMGRFGFKQALAGASYADTDITSVKLTLTGTASANDISDVKLYYDSNCDGLAGTLLGNGVLTGNPASRTFTIGAGQATVEASSSTPPKRCLYVEYVIAAGAVNGNTAGVEIAASPDIVNSQNYAIAANTQPPINLGTAGTITGATTVTWLGTTSTAWATGANWSTGAAPTSSQNCNIDSSTFNPIISAGGAVCKTVTIGNGSLTINTGQKLSVYGGFTNTGTLTLNGTATIEFADGGVASNQTISSTSTIGSISFAKTGGGNINIASNNLTITSLINMAAGQNFDFLVPSGKNLTLSGGATVSAGTFTIAAGGTVTMGNTTTFTVGASGKLNMVGSSSSVLATMTGGSNKFNVVVNGTINARYYKFDHLAAAGVSIEAGSTIDTTNHLQDGNFTYPVDNNTTMLFLKRQVPTNSMDNTKFDKGGSAATGPKNINTTGASAGTLTISGYSGDIAGDAFETEGTYTITWSGGVNTINLTQSAATALGSVTAPSTANLMGRFGFKQTVAGAGFSNADLTSLKLTLKGTAVASDVSAVRIYYETDCNSAGGTLIGTGTFSGSPATTTFTLSAGQATIPSHATTPPTVCIYVEYDIPSGATNGNTVGVEIAASAHVTNDQGYAIASGTPTPVNLGTPIAISGATNTTWSGAASNVWTTAGNWSNGVPTSTVNCTIPSVATAPVVTAGTIVCKSVSITGSMTMSGGTWDVHGDFVSSGTFTQSGAAAINFQGTAAQALNSTSQINSITFGKTAGTVSVTGTNVPITTISFAGGSGYSFIVNTGKIATISNSFAVATGKTLQIQNGGTVKMANGTVVTINSGGILKMVGTSTVSLATMTSTGGAAAYTVVVDGTIEARYFTFDHLGTNGVRINGTINATNHLQDCNFTYPVNSNSTLLKLNVANPSTTMDNCKFDRAGSAAATITTIDASAVGATGTLTLNSYSGDLGGSGDIDSGTYVVTWAGGLNTINITRDAAGPASVNAGSTYNMGRFGFQQVLAGASYSDADITTLKLTATGTASAADITQVRVYYDSDCDSAAGTLIGSGAFSGSPLAKTFTFSTGDARIHKDASAPPKRCIYVEMDIAAGATNNNTISAKINASADFVNNQNYAVATAFPVSLSTTPATIIGATSTTWTGAVSTAWATAGNWSNGVPTSTVSCTLVDVANDPVISTATESCKNVTIGNGVLTINNGSTLQVYGNYDNTSGSVTMTGTGTLRVLDGGTASAQTISSTAQAITNLTFTKTTGGSVRVNASGTITNLTIPGGSNFTFQIPASTTLTLTNGLTVSAGTVEVQNGGVLLIAAGQGITVNGGTFRVNGVNDQTTSNKGRIGVSGAGTWSFTSTSGVVNLVGFLIDDIGVNGLNIGGTTNLSNLRGGQFRNLSTSYASVKAIQFNTSTLPATPVDNIGWNWGPNNAYPANTDGYKVASSTGCGGATISITGWFGDWYENTTTFDVSTKVSNTSCNITLGASASPVSMMTLSAKPYDGKVAIEWETGSEWDHRGFNVYRSLDITTGYVQINANLVRNVISSTSSRGKYRFIDTQVSNGTLYYYMVEDIATNGDKEKHGPVNARPMAGLGVPPATASDTNGSTTDPNAGSGNNPTTGPIQTPGLVDLGNGVHILAQTNSSLRLEIVPPPAAWTASTWNGSYWKLTVPGYSSILTAGYPEIVERTVLVEVSNQHSTAAVASSVVTEAAPVAKKIQPAPQWAVDGGGVLQPSYAEDAAVYATAGYLPSTYFSIDNNLKSINGKVYLAVKINPYKYDAVAQSAKAASKIVLNINLDGAPIWGGQTPSVDLSMSPSAVDGVLRIRFNKSGFYELTYDDLKTANVEGPFDGRSINDLRMYYRGEEIPLSIVSGGANFSTGDKIRFFVNQVRSQEDDYAEVVLSNYDIKSSGIPAWRMDHVNASPATFTTVSPEVGAYFKVSAETDLMFLDDYPLGDDQDHFYWQRIYADRGGPNNPYPAAAQMNIPINLSRLDQNSSRPVYVRVYLRGRPHIAKNPTHHIGLYLNNIVYRIAEKAFDENVPIRVDFAVPANYFFDGTNTIKLIALGDMVPANNTDIIDIDRIEVEFEGERRAIGNIADVPNKYKDKQISVKGFSTANVVVYDVSQMSNRVSILDSVQWSSSDGGVTNNATFGTPSNSLADMGTRYVLIADGQYLKPISLSLNEGAASALRSASIGADLIIVGPKTLLEYSDKLVSAREQEGLRVVRAPLEQIYAEFSHGVVSSQGIRDFVLFAYNNWQAPKPRYLLFIGDATYDPRDRSGYSRVDANTLTPLPLSGGVVVDFGGDNFFVANPDGSDLPLMAVGRIPTSKPDLLQDYINKILSYESGNSSPNTTTAMRRTVFVNDKASLGENFSRDVDDLANSLIATRPDYIYTKINRDVLTDAVAKQNIVNEFNNGPFMMTYLGHGAEDRWAAGTFFTNTDADALTNTRLPIVIALNCRNGYYYDADPEVEGLGEKLIFNNKGGAIAFWGSTAMTIPSAQKKLATSFINEFGSETNLAVYDIRLGDMVRRSLQVMGSDLSSKDTLRSWSLLGDPSMKLPKTVFKTEDTSLSSNTDSKSKGFMSCGGIAGGGGPMSMNDIVSVIIEMLTLMVAASLVRSLMRRSRSARVA